MAAASSYTTQDITSLRAAALLTLRSRPKSRRLPRRTSLEKPDDTSSIASTRKAPASPELDYGSDDASENGNNPQIQTEQEEEAGEKEEGEISDDETRRIAQPSSSGMDIDSEPLSDPNSIPNRDTNVATSVLNEIKQPFGPVEPSPFTSGLSPGSISPGPMDAEERSVQGPFISGSIPASSHLFQSPYPRMGSMNTPPGLSYVNAEYVRPSLKMTAAEFAEAKEIIIDLLGWNVPVDYLIHCGLTREVIYYVFTELNLRLPNDFDTTGIIPYRPPEEIEPGRLSAKGPGSAFPTNSLLPTAVPSSEPQPSWHSPSLSPTAAKLYATLPSPRSRQSPKPPNLVDMYSEPIPGLQNASSSSQTQTATAIIVANGAPAVQSITEFSKHGYSGNLDEMETLRRQELLARKAALASRRKMESKKETALTSSLETNVIGFVDTPPVSADTVDSFLNSIASTTVLKKVTADVVMEDSERQPPTPSTELSITSGQQTVGPLKRPPNKRAVASDWIDSEAPSRNSPYPSLNGNDRHPNFQRASNTSTPSFANLIPNRKVIIDFSDSEDDLAEIPPIPSQTPVVVSVKTTSQVGGTPEPGNLTAAKQQQMQIPTPEALLLKEQEIKRMKELIAEREKLRLKSLANPPKSSTPPPVVPSSVNPSACSSNSPEATVSNERDTGPRVKQERHITPPFSPPENNELPASCEIQDDSTMKDNFSADAQTVISTDHSSSDAPPIDATKTSVDDNSPILITAEHEQVASVVPVPDLSRPVHYDYSLASQSDTTSFGTQFTDYISPLSIFPYPQRSFVADSKFSVDDASYSSTALFPSVFADRPISEQLSELLRPLCSKVVSRLNPMRLLCPFEIPGGGKCQDSTCRHAHLRDFEPTDDETAQYLSRIFLAPQVSFQMIRSALLRVRTSKQDLDFENRVMQALDHLGVR